MLAGVGSRSYLDSGCGKGPGAGAAVRLSRDVGWTRRGPCSATITAGWSSAAAPESRPPPSTRPCVNVLDTDEPAVASPRPPCPLADGRIAARPAVTTLQRGGGLAAQLEFDAENAPELVAAAFEEIQVELGAPLVGCPTATRSATTSSRGRNAEVAPRARRIPPATSQRGALIQAANGRRRVAVGALEELHSRDRRGAGTDVDEVEALDPCGGPVTSSSRNQRCRPGGTLAAGSRASPRRCRCPAWPSGRGGQQRTSGRPQDRASTAAARARQGHPE